MRRYVSPARSSMPATARRPRKASSASPSKGWRTGSRNATTPAAPVTPAAAVRVPARRRAACRSSVGVAAKTSRTVSLNWRMLAKPAPNATCENGSSVVSMSIRAVCARCARARASGPAPTSARSSRCRWRSL